MEKKLLTIDVSHGTTHDGPGMRTTVFVKGCSLACQWCQNPESISAKNQVWWSERDCIGCLSCAQACPEKAIAFSPEGLQLDRSLCVDCGVCAEVCPSTALSLTGQEYIMQELLAEILRDRHFYRAFGGGVTCSGGEPLLQADFVAELFRRLEAEGIPTALDTCGCAPEKNLAAVLPWTDLVLYDMKLMDPQRHRQYTGADNRRCLENLLFTGEYIRKSPRPVDLWIRTPLIPGVTATEENLRAIGSFISTHLSDVVSRWELCAFNGVCVGKYEKLGRTWAFAGQGPMTAGQIAPLEALAREYVGADRLLVTGMIRQDGP